MKDGNELLIAKYKLDIIDAVKNNQVVIIVGQTGCGKSTQVAQYLYQNRREIKLDNYGMIACLHPRTAAAITLANRVAFETHTQLGTLVGYRIRFYSCFSKQTRIMFMTAGFMTRLLCFKKSFHRYSVVIIDEAHERSIQNDILMGQTKQIMEKDSQVKLVIMSATMNVNQVKAYYPKAKVVHVAHVEDRVEVIYRCAIKNDYLAMIMEIVNDIIDKKLPGDILIFLPSELKVRECKEALKVVNEYPIVLKFYSAMEKQKKMKVFQYYKGRRKIICATNAAETSLTIDGVNFVIDSGLRMNVVYNHELRVENWLTAKISWAEAEQRKGRTGRTAPGTCYRLYSETDIDPTMNLIESLKSIPCFSKESKDLQRKIVENIKLEFTLGHLKNICKMSDLIAEETSKIKEPSVNLVQFIRNMFKTDENCLSCFSEEFRERLLKALSREKYFNSITEEKQTILLDEIIKKCSLAQLHCLTKRTKFSAKNVDSNENFFRKLQKVFNEEDLAENIFDTEKFSSYPIPEIRVANLGSTVLTLKSMGYRDVTTFPFIVAPDSGNIDLSIEHLKELDLLNADESLTELGSEVANLPLSPSLGKVAVIGSTSSVRKEIFIILSLLSVRYIFKSQKVPHPKYCSPDGYLIELLTVYEEALEEDFSKEWCKANGIIRSNLQYAHLIVQQFGQLLPADLLYKSLFGDNRNSEIKAIFLCGFFHNLTYLKSSKDEEKIEDKVPNEKLDIIDEKEKRVKTEKRDIFISVMGKECVVENSQKLDKDCNIIMPIILKMTNNERITMRHCTSFGKELLEAIEPRYFNIPVKFWTDFLESVSKQVTVN